MDVVKVGLKIDGVDNLTTLFRLFETNDYHFTTKNYMGDDILINSLTDFGEKSLEKEIVKYFSNELTQEDIKNADLIFASSTFNSSYLGDFIGNIALGKRTDMFALERVNYNYLASKIYNNLGGEGYCFSVTSGCNSVFDALFLAKSLLETGVSQKVIILGVDEYSGRPSLHGHWRMGLHTKEKVFPFSNKNKFIPVDAFSYMVVEKRNEKDVKFSIDKIKTFNRKKLKDEDYVKMVTSHFNLSRIDYINSKALGISGIDNTDKMLSDVTKVQITSLKGVFGHAISSSIVLQMLWSYWAKQKGVIPMTIVNEHTNVDNLVKENIEKKGVSHVLVTSSGLGGSLGVLELVL